MPSTDEFETELRRDFTLSGMRSGMLEERWLDAQ
jgi:hypothetical protein